MANARGLSYLYPAVPIMNVVSMVLCLLLVPGFWKTRIVALVTLVVWIFLANLINFIGTIQWRGNTNDVPILAAFIGVFWRILRVGCFATTACFAHFTWQRLQPLSMRQLYDTRRRNNLIHFVVSVIVPLLWAPLSLVSCPYRYRIVEDFGPAMGVRDDWPGFAMGVRFPQILSFLASILFNTLALVTHWRTKREDIESDLLKHHSSVRTRKLLLLALSNILLAAYGIFRPVSDWLKIESVAPRSFAENIASLQHVFRETRSVVEETDDVDVTGGLIVPLLGFYLFAWFGCGEEARKAYQEVLMKPVRLIILAVEEHRPHMGSSHPSWSCIAFRRPKLPQGLANCLPLTRPNAPQITPCTSVTPGDNGPGPSVTPANNSPSDPVGNVIDIRRQGTAPSREATRRLSTHKPPSVTLNPANAIPSALVIPLRRLSCHKPPLVPFLPPNVHVIAGLDASGSVALRAEATDSARRQEKFALRPPSRRMSYHKPTFVPLAPANAGAIANGSGQTVSPVDVPRDLISDRNARLQAERVLNSCVAPTPFLSLSTSTSTAPLPFSAAFSSVPPPPILLGPSTFTAPPPLSDVSMPLLTPSTRTPAPPYQHINSFLDHVL